MSGLNDFLREARFESDEAQFERDVESGLIPEAEYAQKIRLVGQESSPLAVHRGFKSADGWEKFFTEYKPDDGPLPMAPELE